MTSTVLRRIQIESDALWAHWLRGDANDCEIVRLDRKIVAEDYAFISQYFADVNRFPYFMEADLDSMKGENFVQLTKKIYKVSASNVIKSVRTVALPKSIVGELDMSGKVYGTHVEIMGAPPPGSRFSTSSCSCPRAGCVCASEFQRRRFLRGRPPGRLPWRRVGCAEGYWLDIRPRRCPRCLRAHGPRLRPWVSRANAPRTVLCLMPSIIRKTSTAADQSHRDIPSDAHHGGHRARRQLIHASRGLARNRPMGRLSAIAGRAAGRPPMP